ncbi:FAD-dependent oxidoreductase [Pseudoluteimonas lycopersici]|uniref:FAD-dependent oxidoreductase n=1 Tax=Pseudoluteimonas lycopersici TaxID=1324796 RepID=A0A516V5C1_9GAMM|nr:NAD(P)/FAD-dependent oxidoreductase [Lysobacter lycopersici]QDQ73725.1 FAD-dependent oxidoreductase [Lysobacter lycopersici]
MGRTPLYHLLQRAARIARASLHAPQPLDELLDLAHERRIDITRRRLLQGGSAALVLAGCKTMPNPMQPKGEEVAIVGAGIAGLTAAWRLRQQGVRVRVYEAQNRIGGRMFSLANHFPDGQVVELGGELIDTSHVRLRALAGELGLPLDDLLEGDTDCDTWYFDGRAIGEEEIVRAFVPVAAAIERDLAAAGDGDYDYRDQNPAFRELDSISITQWFDRNGVSGWLRKLLDVAYTTEMGLECGEQSALNFLTFIGTDADAFKVFGESDERSHVRGGNDLVPKTLAARMDDAIETGHALEAVRSDGDGFALALRSGAATREVRARQVVLALPFTLLRKVRIAVDMPEAKRRSIAELGYGTNAKLMIGFDHRPWRDHGANGASMSDLAFQTTWETSRKQPGSAGILTNFTGGRHGVELGTGSAADQAARAVADLERVFPGVAAARSGAREVRMHWPTHPWTQGSYACFQPGQWSALRGAIGESVGGLHFAGEHCALETQGFMEGGCESGEIAAAAVGARLGLAQVLRIRSRSRRSANVYAAV